MDPWAWVAVVVAVLALTAWYLSYTAARLDRLHARVEGTLSSLDAQLVRRAEVVLELVNSGLLDAASALLLAEAATSSLEASERAEVSSEVTEHGVDPPRRAVEAELTQAMLTVLTPQTIEVLRQNADAAEPLLRLRNVGERVQLARRFHNDAVHDVRRVRGQLPVRAFRLAGRTRMPQPAEFDDRVPQAL